MASFGGGGIGEAVTELYLLLSRDESSLYFRDC